MSYRTNRKTGNRFPVGLTESQLVRIGREEAEEVPKSRKLKQKVLNEVKNYNEEYGVASLADVVTEINARGKDLVFEGELAIYSTRNELSVRKALEQLIREGRVRRVKVKGAKAGFVAA